MVSKKTGVDLFMKIYVRSTTDYEPCELYGELYEIFCKLRKIDDAWSASIPSQEELDSKNYIQWKNTLLNTARYLIEIDYDIWVYSDAESYGDRIAELLSLFKNPKYKQTKQIWEAAKAEYYANITE